jgi:hypothetical protein
MVKKIVLAIALAGLAFPAFAQSGSELRGRGMEQTVPYLGPGADPPNQGSMPRPSPNMGDLCDGGYGRYDWYGKLQQLALGRSECKGGTE